MNIPNQSQNSKYLLEFFFAWSPMPNDVMFENKLPALQIPLCKKGHTQPDFKVVLFSCNALDFMEL